MEQIDGKNYAIPHDISLDKEYYFFFKIEAE